MSIYAKVQKPPKEEFETVKREKIAKVITTQVFFFYFLGFLLVLKGNAVEEKQTSSSFANEKKYI